MGAEFLLAFSGCKLKPWQNGGGAPSCMWRLVLLDLEDSYMLKVLAKSAGYQVLCKLSKGCQETTSEKALSKILVLHLPGLPAGCCGSFTSLHNTLPDDPPAQASALKVSL